MTSQAYHIPALLQPALDALVTDPEGRYADVTFGGGGHSRGILSRLGPGGKLYCFDRDTEAIETNAIDDPRVTMINGNFRYIKNYLRYEGVEPGTMQGVLADLGVSFHHFDDPARGVSFRFDTPMDMRMNRLGGRTAADLLASATEEDLASWLYNYGQLNGARRMASAIVKARAAEPVTTASRLVDILTPLISPKQQKKELAQAFQALRIVVNDEMAALRNLLNGALEMLAPGGRLAVITYHSLEDRMVKNFMRTGNVEGRENKDFYGRSLSPVRMLGSKPVVADEHEVEQNPRSRSAKLRVAEKVATNL